MGKPNEGPPSVHVISTEVSKIIYSGRSKNGLYCDDKTKPAANNQLLYHVTETEFQDRFYF